MRPLELWAGPECSVVRVRDDYVDEGELTGHAGRPGDLDRLAALGVRAVRQPVLWERAPDGSWADERLERLRELGMRPIVGLVHHGSGPRHTSLLDPAFARGLADHAREVAERYPWVEDYTPVNEPLTTARFSALYGHWYPHTRDARSFVRALLVQCEAVRASMNAIRSVVPTARLCQTEDVGTIFSTPRLAYQARFENERRFLSLDVLTGRVDRDHPLREWLLDHGATEEELGSFVEAPCPPDVVGLNHYVTSDRFLDERVDHYPPHTHGGNGREAYADVEAVRVLGAGLPGHQALLEVLAARYQRPLALTEVHLGCVPEEQIRWLHEAWRGASAARDKGVDVRAVTVWSAFGAVDWSSLLTERRGHYEPGAFDVRHGAPRPTALAAVARDLATKGESDHPLLDGPGWWRRRERISYPVFGAHAPVPSAPRGRPVLVTGARGTLGNALVRACEARGLHVVPLTRAELDITDPGQVARVLDARRPWAVVNAAGYVRVDDAEDEPEACRHENVDGPRALAGACAARGMRLATFSSDLVFDGTKGAAYLESDAVAPLGVYGASKADAERIVLERWPGALVLRTSAFFGPWDTSSFLWHALTALRAGRHFHAAADLVVSPTYVPDLADAALTLLVDGASGVFHLATPAALSWFELARRAAELAGVSTARLVPCAAAELGLRAARPVNSALASGRARLMPPLDDALTRFVASVESPLARTGT